MVDADLVHVLLQRPEPFYPPAVVLLFHGRKIVERIAPQLTVLAEVVRGYAGYSRRIPLLVQLEQLLMGPTVCAVMSHEHGHVPQDCNALIPSVPVQAVPLPEEDVLEQLVMVHAAGQLHLVETDGLGVVAADVFRPLGPGHVFEKFAQSAE